MSSREAWLSARYDSEKKSVIVAYMLLFLGLGWFGGHRFYAGRLGSAITMLVLAVIGAVLGLMTLGLLWIPFAMFLGIWCLIDCFLLPGIISRHNAELADSYFLPSARREGFGRMELAAPHLDRPRQDGPFAIRLHPSDRIGR